MADDRYPRGSGTCKWVSTEWLEERLDDGELMILDCQPNVHDYLAEHVPGARYMNEGLLRVSDGVQPAAYVSPQSIEADLCRLGLAASIPVMVYTGKGPFKGWGDGLEQTMVAYSLARFGHDNIYILDGGIDKWKKEDRPLSQHYADIEVSDFQAEVRREYFVEYEEFKSMKDKDDVLLLDARPPSVYEGQGPWMKPGHIPGAVNLPWASLMTKENARLLRPDSEIREILAEKGATTDKTMICSCGTGREATNEFLLFKWYLGYPKVKIYEGSFTEWCAYPGNPTVTGKNPR